MKIFDCGETHANCTLKNQPVDANPDIAGVGVIVSFLTTTCLAFLIGFTVIFLDRYDSIVAFYHHHISKSTSAPSPYARPYWRSTAFWSRVLSKNLLAFSDTQLLTGLAIQFTGLIKHCDMSVYHWRIITELAFLTTVTHLLTVVALRNYFVRNRWINLPRIFFMLANLGLLGYTSFISYSYDLAGLDLSTSLACFFQGTRPEFGKAFGGKWAALLIGAIGGHVTVILAMYILHQPPDSSQKAWWYYVGAALRTWIVAPVYAMYGIYMAGSVLQYTQALGTPNVVIVGSESEWNFGQFLPVLLLALPLFAGWESFWEEKAEDGEREAWFGRKSRRMWESGAGDLVEVGKLREERGKMGGGSGSEEERAVESEGLMEMRVKPVRRRRRSWEDGGVAGDGSGGQPASGLRTGQDV